MDIFYKDIKTLCAALLECVQTQWVFDVKHLLLDVTGIVVVYSLSHVWLIVSEACANPACV